MVDFSQVTEIMLGSSVVEQIANSQGVVLWSKAGDDPANSYFYVEDISGSDNTLSIQKSDTSAPTIEVFKSSDGTNWSSMGSTSEETPITATIPANGKLYLKATADTWSEYQFDYNSINASEAYNVGGNIMSLLYGDDFQNQTSFPSWNGYNFCNIFNNSNLVSAASLVLPATTLADSCYKEMFNGCTALTTAPALPATTLAEHCYQQMFYGCTSLTTAPALPATALADWCYAYMFNGCTALTTAPALPATTLVNSCYSSMFQNCIALTTAPALPATALADWCYAGMFYGCTNLTTAPALPATTLVNRCYNDMFNGCRRLNKVITYATNISASNCLNNWLKNTAATGDFYNLGGATYPSGESGIPSGWTEHTSL